MSVNEKLLAVQAELKAPKEQYNNFGKYTYRSCEDILEAVKPLLAKNKATLRIADEIMLIGERFYIKATATFADIETGEAVTNTAFAREDETKKGMDGSQITGTASSYARKYCLNGLFLIDDTKDADTDEYKIQQDEAKKSVSKPKQNKVTSTNDNGNVRYINGVDLQVKVKDVWYDVESLATNQLEWLAKNPEYAEAKQAIEAVLNSRSV